MFIQRDRETYRRETYRVTERLLGRELVKGLNV